MGMSYLCSTMPWASARRLEGWHLESSKGSFTHMSGSWHWWFTGVLSSSLHGLFHMAWAFSWCGSWVPGVRETYCFLWPNPGDHTTSLPPYSVGRGNFRVLLGFKGKENRFHLSMENCQFHVLEEHVGGDTCWCSHLTVCYGVQGRFIGKVSFEWRFKGGKGGSCMPISI